MRRIFIKQCKICGKDFECKNTKALYCSNKCEDKNKKYHDKRNDKIKVHCDFQVSERCCKNYEISVRAFEDNKNRNNGKQICLYCSRKTKFSGRDNPNTKYMIDDNFFKEIDSESKAYLLGWIASDGSITKGQVTIAIDKVDKETLIILKDIVCKDLPIFPKENLFGFSICSQEISKDVCTWLKIEPKKKSNVVQLPNLSDELMWLFLRGYFEGDGHLCNLENRSPHCKIYSDSKNILEQIKDFINIPCNISGSSIQWNGNNALDFLSKIYKNSSNSILRLNRKYDRYLEWSVWVPGLNGKSHPEFKVCKTRKDAVLPSKSHASDSGYDITVLEKVKEFGTTSLYTCGIKVSPGYGWYFDLVPRSSIIKTGYILSNSVGIIDRTYKGEIMVALTKIDPNAPDLELPNRIAQLIPRPIISVEIQEVSLEELMEETKRGEGGFGSTN